VVGYPAETSDMAGKSPVVASEEQAARLRRLAVSRDRGSTRAAGSSQFN
jgi:hypothetical protein